MSDYFMILRSGPGDEAFIRELNDRIESLVMILDSVFLYDHSNRLSETLTEHYWQEKARDGATVCLVDDLEMPARYIYIAGPNKEQCERIWKNLRLIIPVVPVEELREKARNPESDPGALARLALALNDAFDQEAFDSIVRGIESSSLRVRTDAATAIVVLKWKRFIPPLERALALETTEEGRNALQHVLEVCRARGTEP
jgi:hypothetical protein